MESFTVEGGTSRWKGSITPQGAKNEDSAGDLCSPCFTHEEVTIQNIPDILDVKRPDPAVEADRVSG